MSFKDIFILSTGSDFVQWSRTFYAVLDEAVMGNIHVKISITFLLDCLIQFIRGINKKYTKPLDKSV